MTARSRGESARAIQALDDAARAAAPIHGVSVGSWDDRSSWRVDFRDEATPEQRKAAADALAAFDPEKHYTAPVAPPVSAQNYSAE